MREAFVGRLSLVVPIINFRRKKSSMVSVASRKGVMVHLAGGLGGGFPPSCWLHVLSTSLPIR